MSAYDLFLRLGGYKRREGYLCHCPSHDDKNPSLSVKETTDGVLLWHCFAGCTFDEVYTALKSRGILGSSLSRRKNEMQ